MMMMMMAMGRDLCVGLCFSRVRVLVRLVIPCSPCDS